MHARCGAMPTLRRDDHGALSTATIFDDAVYFTEALSLAIDQTEADIEAKLVLLAQESGIQDPYQIICPPHDMSRALSTVTLDSDHRSSISVHSQETQSTSVTSAHSRTSRDQVYRSEPLPTQRMPRIATQASSTVEHADSVLGTSPRSVKERSCSSVLSASNSVVSSSSSSTGLLPRRKRTSVLFRMFRKGSSSCTSQSHQGHGKGRGLKLECGHSLSPYAIRIHIDEAQQRGGQAIPSCCGISLPREALDVVMPEGMAGLVIDRRPSSSETASAQDTSYCEKDVSLIDLTCQATIHSQPVPSTSLPPLPSHRRHEVISLDSALANEAFLSFRSQEKEQFEQVSGFESNQRKALSAYHIHSLKRLAAQHKASKDSKVEQHIQDLERLEELQIMAEHDLRKAQGVETKNVATALKHMEAYCLGSGQSHPDHPHTVTEEDFKKLDRQRMLQQSLPRRHENAINVLRAKQERDLKNRVQKHGMELDLLDAAHNQERVTEESEHAKDMERLEVTIDARRKRLLRRWDLKFEMWRRDWEEQHGNKVTICLEHETWPLQTSETMIPIPESSTLSQYIQVAT